MTCLPSCPRCDRPIGLAPVGQVRGFFKNGQFHQLRVCNPCAAVLDVPKAGERKPLRSDA